MRRWTRALPIIDTLRSYRRIDFGYDLVAGLVLGVVTVPQAVAYAFLAGLPAQAGLYACLAPMVIYAVLGSSRQLIVGPVAIAALMVAATVGEHAPAHSDAYLGITTIVCLQVGILLLLLRLLRMGGIVNLLSHPVITGFVNAAAILIIISQLPAFTGIAIDRGDNAADRLAQILSGIGNLDSVAVGIGVASLAGVWLVRRYAGLAMRDRDHPVSRTGPMIVAIAGTGAVAIFGLNVDTVGFVPAGLPEFAPPPFDLSLWLDLAPAAVVDAEAPQRVPRVRVVGVEQQAAVGAVRIEEARLVEAGLVVGGEVVLREALPAVGAAQLPRLGEGVDLPGVHVHRPPAGRAVAVGPHHPRARDAGAEDHRPQIVEGVSAPQPGAVLGAGADPVVGAEAVEQLGRVEDGGHRGYRRASAWSRVRRR